eukprot:GHRR01031771.1.p1 GENE.GHRR01031771.1~~GHRR01031771.1.p1  ORF type:complete len:123 (-),score=21.57 GHRR01031771.1:426-794(-)
MTLSGFSLSTLLNHAANSGFLANTTMPDVPTSSLCVLSSEPQGKPRASAVQHTTLSSRLSTVGGTCSGSQHNSADGPFPCSSEASSIVNGSIQHVTRVSLHNCCKMLQVAKQNRLPMPLHCA